MLTHNCLELTKRAVASVQVQDVQTDIMIFDNRSTDGTIAWIESATIASTNFNLNCFISSENEGVSAGWNKVLRYYFSTPWMCDHVLVVNNDVVLPPWFYRELLSYDAPFVSGFSVGTMEEMGDTPPPRVPLTGGPDFSAFLIRRDTWEKIGPFDEGMKHYASDCDYHIRAAQAGIPLLTAHAPFYHERSSTLNHASPEDRDAILSQAHLDRKYFEEKWGFTVGSQEFMEAVQCKSGNDVPFPGEVR